MTYAAGTITVQSRIESPVLAPDPALVAVERFERTRAGFDGFLTANERADGLLAAARAKQAGLATGTRAFESLRLEIIDLEELQRQEDDWGDQHEADLADLAEAVPTTWAGQVAMTAVLAHQAEQGVDDALIRTGLRSLAAGLANVGRDLLD